MSYVSYEDRVGVLVFELADDQTVQEFAAVGAAGQWLQTGDIPELATKIGNNLWDPVRFSQMNRRAEMLARHRVVTTAALQEQVVAARKARGIIADCHARLGGKKIGPGLSALEKTLFDALSRAKDLLDAAGAKE